MLMKCNFLNINTFQVIIMKAKYSISIQLMSSMTRDTVHTIQDVMNQIILCIYPIIGLVANALVL